MVTTASKRFPQQRLAFHAPNKLPLYIVCKNKQPLEYLKPKHTTHLRDKTPRANRRVGNWNKMYGILYEIQIGNI